MKNFGTKKWLSLLLVGAILPFMFCSCGKKTKDDESKDKDELRGTISISGAFALYPMAVKWVEEFKKIHPAVRIDISAGGAGKGMADALSGMTDLGMVSRGIKDEEIAQGAWWVAVTRDAVLPTINSKNPVIEQLRTQGLTKNQFVSMFLNEKQLTWGSLVKTTSKEKVNVFTRSDACGAAEMWGKYLGKDQESLKGIGVFGDPGMADAIKKDFNSIGFNNVNYVFDFSTRKNYEGVEIVPIDINENGTIDPDENFYKTLDEIMTAIREGKYPSPPARDLYFVSNGKPQKPEVIAFLNWILTEGQQFVDQAGYVKLNETQISEESKKLK